MAASRDEIRIDLSTIVQEPHNVSWLSTHRIDAGSGNPCAAASSRARATRSTDAVDRYPKAERARGYLIAKGTEEPDSG